MKAIFLNCTLKSSPVTSHTQALMETSQKILEEEKIETQIIRPADLKIDPTIDPEYEDDDWPELYQKILASRIVVLGSPIWLGEMSSIAARIVERLYAHSAETNKDGQYIYYNKVGGAMVTGNEDGAKHVSRNLLYSLSHIGFTIPPQADAYWVGEAGPGPSYIDAGKNNEFTRKNTRIMTWNLIHFARLFQQIPIPVQGNTVK